MRISPSCLLLGLLLLAAPAQAGESLFVAKAPLEVNNQIRGIYDFCLSYEDARVERDALTVAISNNHPIERYNRTKPRTRCYRNAITFTPLEAVPTLFGQDYYFFEDPNGNYACPKGAKTKRCSVSVTDIKFIKATIHYSKMEFPIYVLLMGQELVDGNGTVLTASN